MSENSSIEASSSATTDEAAEIAIKISDLSVWFGQGADRVDAVKSASFVLPRGASFGLVGESGSGKSTILRALTGLVT
ncbi:MAG: peptide/nickel transport system ATP-binding protein, partial [Pseudomonadales bacterium]